MEKASEKKDKVLRPQNLSPAPPIGQPAWMTQHFFPSLCQPLATPGDTLPEHIPAVQAQGNGRTDEHQQCVCVRDQVADKAGGPETQPLALIPRKGGGSGIQGGCSSTETHTASGDGHPVHASKLGAALPASTRPPSTPFTEPPHLLLCAR